MSQVADVSSTSLLGCKQASDRDTGRSRCAQRAAQDLRAAQVERHPLGAARQIGKMLHQRSVPMKFSMVYRFNQPPVWNFLCQQHCLLDQFVFRCNWRYSGATCDWWFSVKVLTPLYYLFPFQVGILPSNQPWVPRRCRCAKWNVIQLTDPDRTWKGISIAIPMCVCVCVMIKSCPRCLAISAGKRFGTSNTNLNMCMQQWCLCKCSSNSFGENRRVSPGAGGRKETLHLLCSTRAATRHQLTWLAVENNPRSWEPILFIA